ncbi:MAG: lysine methyltransferase 3 [Desulfovibrionales bacterium]|nr:lysine methyltransferase 3 [Desulfovibrionales bacterium]
MMAKMAETARMEERVADTDTQRSGMDIHELMQQAGRKFKVDFKSVKSGDQTIEVLQIQNMTDYLERLAARSDGPVDLPFWAKIWPTCVFAGYLLGSTKGAGKSLLEVGAGVGVCGLLAALAGYEVTLTDVDEDALLFCRINILKNGLSGRAQTAKADFTKDRLGRVFDVFVGCEVLYRPQNYPGLLEFMDLHLAEDGEAFFAMDDSRAGREFFQAASQGYEIRVLPVPAVGKGETRRSVVYRLRRKSS